MGTVLTITDESFETEVLGSEKPFLLDFWASWCGPCLREMPNMKDLHRTYKEKGLTIIGISLDEDTDSWNQAINEYKLNIWPQILDMESNDESISDVYNVQSIPHYILIDKQGKIVARWQLEQINLDDFLK